LLVLLVGIDGWLRCAFLNDDHTSRATRHGCTKKQNEDAESHGGTILPAHETRPRAVCFCSDDGCVRRLRPEAGHADTDTDNDVIRGASGRTSVAGLFRQVLRRRGALALGAEG